MEIVRKFVLGILGSLFVLLLLATAFDIGLVRTAGNRQATKRLVSESGVYSTVVPNILQQQKTISTRFGDIPATDPVVQQAAHQAITPQFVRQNSEAAIDNIYDWLEGKVGQPSFKFDLSTAQDDFAVNVAAAVQGRLAKLPSCTLAQNLAISRSGSFSALNSACLPFGVTPASAANQLKNEIAGQHNFLKDANFSVADLKDGSGQPYFEQPSVKKIPLQYQRLKKTPAVLSILTVLAGLGLVLLSANRLKGLRHAGIILAAIGLLMMAFAYGINRAVSTKITPKIQLDNAVLQQDIRKLVTDVAGQINGNYWFFGGLYAATGLAAIGSAEYYLRRGRPEPGDANENAPADSGSVKRL